MNVALKPYTARVVAISLRLLILTALTCFIGMSVFNSAAISAGGSHRNTKRLPGNSSASKDNLSRTKPLPSTLRTTALIGATIIDGNGGPPVRNGVVLISGDKIIRVGTKRSVRIPKSAKIIDVTGKYILPGLIDLHVHYHDWMGELFVANGVTTVKDLGNDLDWIARVSALERQGRFVGPRIIYVGNGLDSPPPSKMTHIGLTSLSMAIAAVDVQHSRGASAVKVREKITIPLLKAIARESHKLGIPVTGHLRSVDARQAALAGIDGLEHASGVVQALTDYPRKTNPDQNELETFYSDISAFSLIDPAKAADLAKFLAARKVAIIPTMVSWWRIASDRRDTFASEDAEYAANPALAYIPGDAKKILKTSFVYKSRGADDARIQLAYARLKDFLIAFHNAGGTILAGSDTFFSVPGVSLQREIMMLVDTGLTPMQAITAATRDNARFLRKKSQLGTVAPGKLADIIVVGADPLSDINNIGRIEMVMKGGAFQDTHYHPDYSIPLPDPSLTRPVWLEKQLTEK